MFKNLKLVFIIILFIILLLIIKLNKSNEFFSVEETNFKVIIPFYNQTYNDLKRCIKSIEKQTYKNYSVCIVDDASDKNLDELKKLEKEYSNNSKFKYIRKKVNGGQISSNITGMKELNSKDDDVIILVDGDDALYDKNVFSYLNETYKNSDINLTFGNYVLRKNNIIQNNIIRPCNNNNLKEMISNNSFRNNLKFGASHLKTFKFKLFKKINKKDLMKDGEYIKTSTDLAMMFPMLEMSRYKFKCIDKPLYIYTYDNPNSLHNNNIKKQKQIVMDRHIRKCKKYNNLF